ncbi:hypothetical protein NDU88_001987 [Pleurodeles waltl]|uniref:Uncharacterized protein n=1 Tax=Pleurodeles waltl TaxID=8319 RepID=A0AAV7MM14_PLEWA|nr:hypothetical protein NDU88_001987 [Pleurodeles waltl]
MKALSIKKKPKAGALGGRDKGRGRGRGISACPWHVRPTVNEKAEVWPKGDGDSRCVRANLNDVSFFVFAGLRSGSCWDKGYIRYYTATTGE